LAGELDAMWVHTLQCNRVIIRTARDGVVLPVELRSVLRLDRLAFTINPRRRHSIASLDGGVDRGLVLWSWARTERGLGEVENPGADERIRLGNARRGNGRD